MKEKALQIKVRRNPCWREAEQPKRGATDADSCTSHSFSTFICVKAYCPSEKNLALKKRRKKYIVGG